MNKYIAKLSEISEKPERIILGLMSGTSLDGLDIALCKVSGTGRATNIEVIRFTTVEYDSELRGMLASIQSKDKVDTRLLTYLHSELGNLYGDWILAVLGEWGINSEDIDLIASHGQTVYHAPAENEGSLNATFQIVDGDHIAQKTGFITISDFRQKHTAIGGQGAPLAGIFDKVLFRSDSQNRMLLNLGGIANFTWLPPIDSGGQVITADTGPANTLINEAMQKYFERPYDEGGNTASRAAVHSELVRYVLLEPYFRKPFPKTTGQEDFRLAYIEELMQGHQIELTPEDLVASLTAITSQSIRRAVDEVAGDQEFECYVSGGGVHNKTLMEDLRKRIPQAAFRAFEELGIPADAKEASMMAFFANELIAGEGFPIPAVTEENVHLGKISLPG
ncbi:MAG: anhydro-N-acetylmuramic acid kinase [Gracilimonas sp.]|uniref:anhydro-N-acetylmuramic acid kinase n=1 Tax=Gracilimonas sp. TaxID=1974203 RepID=UPI00375219C2|nr:anhydro-N-acetylmuramic acid kinase [Gracilimonas sp.]